MPNNDEPNQVEIYTDGGCDPNPGPGGWGAVLVSGGRTKEISGADANTTNNRMELTAAIQALSLLKRPCQVALYTDSTYLRDGITRWIPRWQAHDWLKADGSPVENKDLWGQLLNAEEPHDVEWHWIRGHRGRRWNERADQLATQARRELLQASGTGQAAPATPRTGSPGSSLARYEVYARGCALGNPGPAGYGAIIVGAQGESLRSGGWPVASNNVMDLWAIIYALQSLPGPARVTVHTSSKYVIDGATRWLPSWERSGWRTQSGQPVKNPELWQELSQVMGDHDIEWHYLANAESDPRADRAYALARAEAEKQRAAP
ncbi:MAG: ribonuclease HI [Anaerolineae bacterium]